LLAVIAKKETIKKMRYVRTLFARKIKLFRGFQGIDTQGFWGHLSPFFGACKNGGND
jgi:hypothetical protein